MSTARVHFRARSRFSPVWSWAVCVLLSGFAGPVSIVAQTQDAAPISNELAEVAAELAEARNRGLHLIARDEMRRAADRLEDARRRQARGQPAAEVRQRLLEARVSLQEARGVLTASNGLFDRALSARRGAVERAADSLVASVWEAAEDDLVEAAERFGRNDIARARTHADRAEALYRQAAGEAERSVRLRGALAARVAARQLEAPVLASEAWEAAEEALADAESRVASSAGEDEIAAADARARGLFERASRIAALSDSIARRAVPLERVMLAHADQLRRLAVALDAGMRPGERAEQLASRLEAGIRQLRAERDSLAEDLVVANRRFTDLNAEVAALGEQLDAAERREAAVRDQLGGLQARQARLREIQALFNPDEGEVLVQGERLTLRLYGLTFQTGESEITDAHVPLLTRVVSVIREFPGAPIRIEGHTDSRGSAPSNRALSQSRAIAVREYLLRSMPISSSRVEARGFGSDRPVASNDTEEGRARNRRIEIVVDMAPQ